MGGRSPAAGCRRPKDGAGQRPGGACGGSVAQPLAAVGRRTGQVSGWAERRAGVLGLPARDGRKVRGKRSASPKPSPCALECGWIGWSFWAWLVALA